ncbi:MAG: hypothetical protein KIS66_01010 [Fimbriimonadaceae bacterium]|nr:hypothetical protein [Fimbriimonadaceae bacterium]
MVPRRRTTTLRWKTPPPEDEEEEPGGGAQPEYPGPSFCQGPNRVQYPNPLINLAPNLSAGVTGVTVPPLDCTICSGQSGGSDQFLTHNVPATYVAFAPAWTAGADPPVGAIVVHQGSFFAYAGGVGGGMLAPSGNPSFWTSLGQTTEALMCLRSLSPGGAPVYRVRPYRSDRLLPRGDELDVLYLSLVVVGGVGQLAYARPSYTWTENALESDAGTSSYATNVPNAANRACSGLPGNDLTGLVLPRKAAQTDAFDPYFSCLACLLAVESAPVIVRDNLDAHVRLFYGPGGTTDTQYPPLPAPSGIESGEVARFPTRVVAEAMFDSTQPANPVRAGADSHDASAAMFALLAYRYAVFGGATGRDWMAANREAVFSALLHNVAKRRRAVYRSTAFGQANGLSLSGPSKQAGPILTWKVGRAYAPDDLVWNTSTVGFDPTLRRKRFRCLSAHTSTATNRPGTGSGWGAVWAAAGSEAEPAGFLTETFQLNESYPVLQALDAIESFVALREIYRLFRLAPWSATRGEYLRFETVSHNGQFWECQDDHIAASGNAPGATNAPWTSLGGGYFSGISADAIFGTTAGQAMRARADELASWCRPGDLENGIRVLFKYDASEANARNETHWIAPRYDANRDSAANGVATANELDRWYPEFLALPYLAICDVRLSKVPATAAANLDLAFARCLTRCPHGHRSRNYGVIATPCAWAAAFAKRGDTTRADDALRFVRRHWPSENEVYREYNHELALRRLAETWLANPSWRFL